MTLKVQLSYKGQRRTIDSPQQLYDQRESIMGGDIDVHQQFILSKIGQEREQGYDPIMATRRTVHIGGEENLRAYRQFLQQQADTIDELLEETQ